MLAIMDYITGLVNLAEETQFSKHRLPTKNEYRDRLIEVGGPPDSLERILKNPNFDKIMKARGLVAEQGELLPNQMAAIHCFLNVADTRPLRTKLLELGITTTQFNGWTKDPFFKAYLEKQATELFESGLPVAHQALMKQVSLGNVRAIKLYYDTFGFGADKQFGSTGDVKMILTRVVEVIQRHVTDPEVLSAIARDFEVVVNGGIPAIRGEIERGSND